MRDNEKCNISHVPYHRLERYLFLNTKYIGVIDPEGPEKYNAEISRCDFLQPPHSTYKHAVMTIKILVKVYPSRATKPK